MPLTTRKTCPVHDLQMDQSGTKYGPRWDCPEPDCDIMAWAKSAPGDQATRTARKEAHWIFDQIWQKHQIMKRGDAYRALRDVMGLKSEECHMALMTEKEAKFVVTWAETVIEEFFNLVRGKDAEKHEHRDSHAHETTHRRKGHPRSRKRETIRGGRRR